MKKKVVLYLFERGDDEKKLTAVKMF